MFQSSRYRLLSVTPGQVWSDKGTEPWVVEISVSLPSDSHLIQGSHPFSGVLSQLVQGQCSKGRSSFSSGKGAIEFAPLPSPGFYSRLFASGAWRPVIGLSTLNLGIQLMVGGKVCQFKVLCFGLSTAPQVFTLVMVPVSAILHRMKVRLRQYLDDWLLQASSREQVLLALRTVLRLCRSLGIVVNWENSWMIPAQRMVYLGVFMDSNYFQGFSCPEESREASLNWLRILVLRQSASVVLATAFRSAVLNDPTRS